MAKPNVKLYNNDVEITWCPGCGDYGILNAVKRALAELEILPHEVLFVSGIGCGSKLPDYINANGLTTLHGRALPIAQGAKLANHDMKVIVVTGDGDGYGIGGNHFVHAVRRNTDLVHIVEDNQVYGLTKGQASPTSPKGFQTTTTPDGSFELAVNPLALAISNGATFVARGFAGDPKHLAELIMAGLRHRGYALIDVLQSCVIYHPMREEITKWWRERVYKLEDEEGYDPTDRDAAWKKSFEYGDRIPIGIFYQDESLPTYEEQVKELKDGPLVKRGAPRLTREEWEPLKAQYM